MAKTPVVPATPYYEQNSIPYASSAYKTSARPSALWKGNEPVGYTALEELTFDVPIADTASWNDYAGVNFDIVVDAGNPSESTNTGRCLYPAGQAGGGAFVNIGHDSIAANNAKEIYYCSAFKLSSNFEYHPTGVNKIFFINVEGYGGGGDPYVFFADSDFDPPKMIPILQGTFPRVFNGATNAGIDRDEWFIVESKQTMNTAGNADGTLKHWINGVLVVDVSDVEWVNSVYIWNSAPKLQPTWGGAGGTVVNNFYLYCGAIYVSWSV